MFEFLATALAAIAIVPAQMQGDRLQAGATCYEIIVGGKPIGTTVQTITRSRDGQRSTWDIVIHQKAEDPRFGRFDMRDQFVVDRKTLLPIRLTSSSGQEGVDRGWHRISLSYGASAIRGTKRTAAGTEAIDVPIAGPVWDGNLWGITFAALPLRRDRQFSIPFWQYDKGLGAFSARVIGSQNADTAIGTVSAWTVEAGTGGGPKTRYVIRKGPRQELAYDRAGAGQRLAKACK